MIVTNEARSAELVILILYPASPCLFYSGPKRSLTRVRKLVNKKMTKNWPKKADVKFPVPKAEHK